MSAQAERLLEREKINTEISLMKAEDALAAKIEDYYKNNDALKIKMEEEKKKRMREEYERVRKIRFEAACKIQKRVRGILGRIAGRLVKVEVKLERSVNNRSEVGLREAIQLADKLDTKPKNIKLLKQNARVSIYIHFIIYLFIYYF